MTNALLEAEALGLDCVQVFTKNQQQWNAKPLEQGAIDEWKTHARRLGWHTASGGDGRVVSHASYLANLASVNPVLYKGSIELMRTEIDRCEQLGIGMLVFHPGAFTTSSLEEGIAKIATAAAQLIKETAGYKTVLCFENVAGQGSTVGRTFEELAALRSRTVEQSGDEGRVAFCIDTAHAHAAGYDLSTRAGAEHVLDEMTAKLGGANIRCMHINDSKTPCGSRVDRHAHIGEGTIGLAGFAAVVNHPRLSAIPKLMETPKEEKKPAGGGGPVWDQINVGRLRSLVGSSESVFAAVTPIGGAASARSPAKGKAGGKTDAKSATKVTAKPAAKAAAKAPAPTKAPGKPAASSKKSGAGKPVRKAATRKSPPASRSSRKG